MMLRRVMIALSSVVLLAAPMAAWQPSAGQEEFMPVDQLPPTEQLAAAPLLVAAYAFVWLALMGVSLADLASRRKGGGRNARAR